MIQIINHRFHASMLHQIPGVKLASQRIIFCDPPYNIGVEYADDPIGDNYSPEGYRMWCNIMLKLLVYVRGPIKLVLEVTESEEGFELYGKYGSDAANWPLVVGNQDGFHLWIGEMDQDRKLKGCWFNAIDKVVKGESVQAGTLGSWPRVEIPWAIIECVLRKYLNNYIKLKDSTATIMDFTSGQFAIDPKIVAANMHKLVASPLTPTYFKLVGTPSDLVELRIV